MTLSCHLKTSVAQTGSQPFVSAKGLIHTFCNTWVVTYSNTEIWFRNLGIKSASLALKHIHSSMKFLKAEMHSPSHTKASISSPKWVTWQNHSFWLITFYTYTGHAWMAASWNLYSNCYSHLTPCLYPDSIPYTDCNVPELLSGST
jgi:hypothetical protein